MRIKNILLFVILIGIIFGSYSCESGTNVIIEESLQELKKVTPIPGATVESLEVIQSNGHDGYLTVRLNSGKQREAWSIEWNKKEAFCILNGAQLYTTRGHEEWNKLNYFMDIKDELRINDPDITTPDIQVVIWSLVNNPPFDVDKISEYANIDSRIYKDGQPLFDVQKVKDIINQIEIHFANSPHKIQGNLPGVTVIENDGQTIIIGEETVYAAKTITNWEPEVDSDYSTCFNEEIIPNVSFANWGWTNGPLSDPSGEMTFDIYAGAGQCDLNKGTRVGELIVEYSSGTFTATYRMIETSEVTDNLYKLTETHLYVGNELYPTLTMGRYTVAPGQYGNQNTHDNVTDFTYEIDDLSGEIYFIAQAVVSGFESEAD